MNISSRKLRHFLWIPIAVVMLACTASATDWYAAPAGKSSGNGTQASPWDIATALASSSVKPGDTVWLQAGTYGDGTLQFNATLSGTASNPIIVRAVPGQRATINGGLQVNGAYTWYWGFEVTNLAVANRNAQFTFGFDIFGEGTRFINLIVHDTGQGFGYWKQAGNTEIYGSLVYNNGYDLPDRGHGHGFYVQNNCGGDPKNIENNIVFRQFGNGTQLYGSSSVCGDNTTYQNNTFFNNGEPSLVTGCIYNIWVGAGAGENNAALIGNRTYASPVCTQEWNTFYHSTNSSILNNYFISPNIYSPLSFQSPGNTNLTMTGNTFWGTLSGFTSSTYPSNSYLTARPTLNMTFVNPNKYEPGRANITIYNWQLSSTVSVDVSAAGLQPGQAYQVFDAENFFAPPIATGTYSTGTPITIPMTNLSAAPVFAWSYIPKSTAPEFGVFVLMPVNPAISTGKPQPPTNLKAVVE